MTFKLKIISTWTEPPTYARPASNNQMMDFAPIVLRSEPDGRDGNGNPVGYSTELRAKFGRTSITDTGVQWWYASVGWTTVYKNDVGVQLYDPLTGTWKKYLATLWRPTFNGARAGNKLVNFVITATNLVETT